MPVDPGLYPGELLPIYMGLVVVSFLVREIRKTKSASRRLVLRFFRNNELNYINDEYGWINLTVLTHRTKRTFVHMYVPGGAAALRVLPVREVCQGSIVRILPVLAVLTAHTPSTRRSCIRCLRFNIRKAENVFRFIDTPRIKMFPTVQQFISLSNCKCVCPQVCSCLGQQQTPLLFIKQLLSYHPFQTQKNKCISYVICW